MLDLLQWPAMGITVLAAWLIASPSARKRMAGFWCFLASNVAWIVWGLHADAYALIVLQVALAALNIRGVHKNDEVSSLEDARAGSESVQVDAAPASAPESWRPISLPAAPR